MAERYINGNNILLFYVNKVTPGTPSSYVYIPVVCLTGNPVTRNRPTTVVASKCGKISTAGDPEYGVTGDGLIVWGNDSTAKKGHTDLVEMFSDNSINSWRVAKAIPESGDNIIDFDGTVSGLNDAYNADANATFSLTISPDATTWVEGKKP